MLRKLRSIQILRGVAACAVVFFHSHSFTEPIDHSAVRIGGAGVDLFFVISGFIMASIAKPSAGRFLFDRWWRIYPLWLIAVTPWIIAKKPVFAVIPSSLTLWPIYGHFTAPALGVGWTLTFELLFYLAVALAMRTRPVVPLALFGMALSGGMITRWPVFEILGNPMIFEFLFGVVIAQLPRDARASIPLLLASVAGFAAAPLSLFHPELVIQLPFFAALRAIFWGLPAALAVYGCLCAEPAFAHRSSAPFVMLGDASYSIYLFHRLADFGETRWALKFIIGVCVGVAAHWLIERSILRLKPRLGAHSEPEQLALQASLRGPPESPIRLGPRVSKA